MSIILDITPEQLTLGGHRSLHAGDDYSYEFTVLRDAIAVDLTGAKIWFTVKEAVIESDAAAKLQLTSAASSEIEITNAVGGVFLVKFVSAGAKATTNIEGLWLYDIQVRLVTGAIITWVSGNIEFLPDLTRVIA